MDMNTLLFTVVCVIMIGMAIWHFRFLVKSQKEDDGRESYETESPEYKGQKMLFMGAALDVSWDLSRKLQKKTEVRSLEIAKADDRFLVTPDDMRKAYDEVIREEHM